MQIFKIVSVIEVLRPTQQPASFLEMEPWFHYENMPIQYTEIFLAVENFIEKNWYF